MYSEYNGTLWCYIEDKIVSIFSLYNQYKINIGSFSFTFKETLCLSITLPIISSVMWKRLYFLPLLWFGCMYPTIVVNDLLFTRTVPLNPFHSASPSLNDLLFSILSLDHCSNPPPPDSPPLAWLGRPPWYGPLAPLLGFRDGTSCWEKVKWLRMSASSESVYSDGARWMKRPFCDRAEASPGGKQRHVHLKVSTGGGRLVRGGVC